MPYYFEWYIEPRVLYVNFSGVMTLEEIEQHATEAVDYMSQSSQMVHVILDGRAIQKFPLNVVKLRQAAVVLDVPNHGWLIAVTENPTLRFLSSIVPQMITKTRTRIVKSPDEAIAFLKEMDRTIDWSQTRDSAFS